jgi:hypothetical protein
MTASTGTVGSDGQKNKELNESHSDMRDKSIEHEYHKIKSKNRFFIENQQEYDRSAEVTVLLPSFLIGIKTKSCSWHTSTLELQK